jgi:hypothetical protein
MSCTALRSSAQSCTGTVRLTPTAGFTDELGQVPACSGGALPSAIQVVGKHPAALSDCSESCHSVRRDAAIACISPAGPSFGGSSIHAVRGRVPHTGRPGRRPQLRRHVLATHRERVALDCCTQAAPFRRGVPVANTVSCMTTRPGHRPSRRSGLAARRVHPRRGSKRCRRDRHNLPRSLATSAHAAYCLLPDLVQARTVLEASKHELRQLPTASPRSARSVPGGRRCRLRCGW